MQTVASAFAASYRLVSLVGPAALAAGSFSILLGSILLFLVLFLFHPLEELALPTVEELTLPTVEELERASLLPTVEELTVL